MCECVGTDYCRPSIYFYVIHFYEDQDKQCAMDEHYPKGLDIYAMEVEVKWKHT